MKKLFVQPEVNAVELSQTEAIMSSVNQLVKSRKSTSYSVTDSDRSASEALAYWKGKND